MSGDLDRGFTHLAALVESANDAIVGIDLDNQIIFWNRGAQKIYGYSASQAIGKCFASLTAPLGSNLSSLDPLWESEILSCTPVRHYTQDGQAIEVMLTVSPIEDVQGKIIGRSIIAKPVPCQNIAAENPQEWISLIAHELRTPLTAITGSLGLLLTGKIGTLPPQGQRMLEIAVKNTERLLRLVNDFLDLQRLQANQWVLKKEECNLLEIMQEAAENVHHLAQKQEIKILISQNPIFLKADRDRLVQLLINLLGNAIKFSPPHSEISLTAALESHPGSSDGTIEDSAIVKIQDQGRGIPLEKQQSIFDVFQQVDPKDAREKQGTGLGLAICRSIVRQHQGQIWVESKLGAGSTFYVKLPLV